MHGVDRALAAVLKRDRGFVLAALVLVTALSWSYVLWLAAGMPDPAAGMSAMDMAGMAMAPAPWTAGYFLLMFVMWSAMMVGMMTPSVAPMVLIYTQVARQSSTLGKPFAPAAWFASGYLIAWTLFALIATTAQWALDRVAALTPMMASASPALAGGLLIAAGLYQWTPLKHGCLSRCRAPLSFVQKHGGFQAHATGSMRLGLLHGANCVGCCWALMALLFAGGVMNVLWIAGLTILVLLEKLVPAGRVVARVAGAAAIAGGLWIAAGL